LPGRQRNSPWGSNELFADKSKASHGDQKTTVDAPAATKESTKKEKKEKKKKNDDGLKRPLSAYMLFNNYRRPMLRQQNPRKFTAVNLF
jgi:hypothetical protein